MSRVRIPVKIWVLKQSVLGPTTGCTVLRFETGRRVVPGSFPDCACRRSRSEFSVVFSETAVNTGKDPLERFQLYSQVPRVTIGLTHTTNQPTTDTYV